MDKQVDEEKEIKRRKEDKGKLEKEMDNNGLRK